MTAFGKYYVMTDDSTDKITKLSSCFTAMEKVSDDAKEVVVNELIKLKNEIQTERKRRIKKA